MTLLLALQDVAPAVPVAVVGVNWEVLIPVIVAGIGVLLGQVFTYLKSRENGKKSDDIAQTNVQQDVKLERIEVLVDGRYGEVLQELADVKRLLASESGRKSDLDRADMAQSRADVQKARVEAADVVRSAAPRGEPVEATAKKIEKIDATTERIEDKIDTGDK